MRTNNSAEAYHRSYFNVLIQHYGFFFDEQNATHADIVWTSTKNQEKQRTF